LTADRTFAAPAGIIIGGASSLAANRMLDQAISRVGRYDGELTDLEVPKLAYGMTLKQLGHTPTWYIGMETLDDLVNTGSSADVVTVHGSPTEVDGPVYGYTGYGTYKRMFAAHSLWNCYPIKPVFGTYVIPRTNFSDGVTLIRPTINDGAYSSGIFQAKEADSPMVVYPKATNSGIWDPDGEMWLPTVTVPRWPADTLGATGTDGHADIVDEVSGVVYSFSELKKDATTGQWRAQQIAWTRLDGLGFADPAHYFQGARAAAVPTSAGMIRGYEIDDGEDMFYHALAMSMTYTGMAASPSYIYPATSGDGDAASTNKGQIPEGALLMLPPTFDLTKITNAKIHKVAATLMKYGAYVVDRNTNTSFVVYAENGYGYELVSDFTNQIPNELELVRAALRQVVSQDGFMTGEGQVRVPETNVDLLSLRGEWTRNYGTDTLAVFDTFSQSLKFGTTAAALRQDQKTGNGTGKVAWAKFVAGKTYTVSTESTDGCLFNFYVWVNGKVSVQSGSLTNGKSYTFVWPTGGYCTVSAYKPAGGPGWIKASLIQLD
jgi:hypothetical protein